MHSLFHVCFRLIFVVDLSLGYVILHDFKMASDFVAVLLRALNDALNLLIVVLLLCSFPVNLFISELFHLIIAFRYGLQ